jgi:hypothetical protein
MERYWHRRSWELQQQARMSGLGLGGGTPANKPDKPTNPPTIDLEDDSGIEALIARGFKVTEYASE